MKVKDVCIVYDSEGDEKGAQKITKLFLNKKILRQEGKRSFFTLQIYFIFRQALSP